MKYRRVIVPGGTFFFTLVTYSRQPILVNEIAVALLREAFRYTLKQHPFTIDACVILPDHMHFLWTMPENDCDYSTRWRLIKSYFSRYFILKSGAEISPSRKIKGEKAIWQRRFWEHIIRDENDFRRHVEYIHFNPVKHGLVDMVVDWPYSSFHQYVRNDLYFADWGVGTGMEMIKNMQEE